MADKVRTMSMPVGPHYSSSTYHVMGCNWLYRQEDPSFLTLYSTYDYYTIYFGLSNKQDGKRKCGDTCSICNQMEPSSVLGEHLFRKRG